MKPLVGHLCWMAAIMACCIWIKPMKGDSQQIQSVVAFAVAIGLTAAYAAYHIGWIEGHHAGWRAGSDKPNSAICLKSDAYQRGNCESREGAGK
jgi:heme A synthase